MKGKGKEKGKGTRRNESKYFLADFWILQYCTRRSGVTTELQREPLFPLFALKMIQITI